MKKINILLFNLGKEVTLKTNTGKEIRVRKEVINDNVFGVTMMGNERILINQLTLKALFQN